MGKPKLVKAGESRSSRADQPVVRRPVFTNWAAEFRAEKANQPTPQSQWRKLFQEMERG